MATLAEPPSTAAAAGLSEVDPEIAALLEQELDRQRDQIELIASENFTWPSVLEAVGSVPTNKYAEGYPGKRYYGGCEIVDQIEQLAIDRAKTLFGAEHVNVQPHAGAQANMAVYLGLMKPGDTVLSLRLDHGGHLTHGLSVNFSGRLYTIAHYGVSRETSLVDYDEVLALAKEHRPKVILCGGSAYPRTVETWEFRKIADEVGALLWCDMAHFSGLVAAGLHPNPVVDCDVVTSTTHKTLAGPRAGFICAARSTRRRSIGRSSPDSRAGRWSTRSPRRRPASASPRRRRSATTRPRCGQTPTSLAAELIAGGLDVLTGGTDTHLLQLDLRAHGVDGEGRRGAAPRSQADHEPQHGAVRRAAADRGIRCPDRYAGSDDARLRRGRLPRGREDHRRCSGRRRRYRVARGKQSSRSASSRPLYPGFRGYTSYAT